MTFEGALAELARPKMYSSYHLEAGPSSTQLWRRTFAAVEVEWDLMVKKLSDEQAKKLREAGAEG